MSTLTEYRVFWVIDVEAESERHAAELALESQGRGGEAHVFVVAEAGANMPDGETIDLDWASDRLRDAAGD